MMIDKLIIYDCDDHILSLSTELSFRQKKRILYLITHAHLVIVSNEYLRKVFLQYNNNVSIIPTPVNVPVKIPLKEVRKNTIFIGWIGTKGNIKYLSKCTAALSRVHAIFGNDIKLLICSNGTYIHPEMETINVEWSIKNELSTLRKIDIGIMPLDDNEWTRGKAGFKALLYMSQGIPSIVSGVGLNNTIVTHSVNGFIANTSNEWCHFLIKLIESSTLRKIIGKNGYESCQNNYSVDVTFEVLNKMLIDLSNKHVV